MLPQVGWWLPLGENWPRLLVTAGLIGAVSLLEAISIAKALAEVHGDHVNADQELLGEQTFPNVTLTVSLQSHSADKWCASGALACSREPVPQLVAGTSANRSTAMRAGLGVSNLLGAAFCAYPSTGSFARSAVQSTSGAKTGAPAPCLCSASLLTLAA